MTTNGDIVMDCQASDSTHTVHLYKYAEGKVVPTRSLHMDQSATMTLMPSDDFVYSDTGSNSGLISWHLPSDVSKLKSEDVLSI